MLLGLIILTGQIIPRHYIMMAGQIRTLIGLTPMQTGPIMPIRLGVTMGIGQTVEHHHITMDGLIHIQIGVTATQIIPITPTHTATANHTQIGRTTKIMRQTHTKIGVIIPTGGITVIHMGTGPTRIRTGLITATRLGATTAIGQIIQHQPTRILGLIHILIGVIVMRIGLTMQIALGQTTRIGLTPRNHHIMMVG